MKRRIATGQSSILGDAPPVATKPTCRICERPLRGVSYDGAHKACLDKAAKEADPSIPIYKRLAEHWDAEFKRVRGVEPIWTGKDRGSLKKAAQVLVPQIGEARVMSMITMCLERGSTLSFMVNEPNAFNGRDPIRGRMQVVQQRPPAKPSPPPAPRALEPIDDANDPWGKWSKANGSRGR